MHYDLNKGLSRVVRALPSKSQEKLDHLLRGILAHKERFSVEGEELVSLNTDVVCFRGLLTTILCTPYERKERWELLVCRWRGTAYILQVETDEKKKARERETDKQRTMSSWGFKFETFLTAESPGGPVLSEDPVNENTEFCCLFRTRLGKLSLVYGAEMDAYQSSSRVEQGEPLRPGNFVEMKTSRNIEQDRQERSFRRYKQLKWWAQSFLVGTKEVLCGWRDDSGLVSRLESFSVRELPRGAVEWQPTVCVNFLSSLLGSLLDKVGAEDDLETVHEVSFLPGQGVKVRTVKVGRGEHFLPTWYTDEVFR